MLKQKIFVILGIALGGNLALANGIPTSPSGGGDGRELQCGYYDKGWEEHGYHYSCGECNARHGDCEERCYNYSYTCTAKGYDENGKIKAFTAEGPNEYRVGRRAIDRCYDSARDCSLSNCAENSHLVRRKSCPKHQLPKGPTKPNPDNKGRQKNR